MARNIVLKTYRISGRNLAPYFLQIEIDGVLERKSFNNFWLLATRITETE